MPTPRQKIALDISTYPSSVEDYAGKPGHEIYGTAVFNEVAQKQYLSKGVFKKLKATTQSGDPLDASIADQVAQGMKEWALAQGASHYTHWFIPLTGGSAEKHDTFLEPMSNGTAMAEFDGNTLIKGEPDASSFPSGGTRATAEARGYTAWDPTSPAFIMKEVNGATLYIPTAFVSYTEEALDHKTPLLRSMEALSTQAVRLLKLFGNKTVKRVFTTLGPEQEYFLIDRRYYEQRPDLIATGRTLFGAPPYRGQELEDHYFGSIRERILAFMMDFDRECWRLGIPAKTRHNEVAPAQFEIAPIFEKSSITADHNMLVMELLRRVALRHGLVCLLHEKPFAALNGNGKHNNWSMATNEGENLLEPGHTPHENAQFLAFLTATISAVDKYAELLRIGISGPGNDHRLGANEAPPAIISIFLGDQLDDVVNQLEKGAASSSKKGGTMELGVTVLPKLPMDATDRNRTSPFAFTGNKFEFRAVGSTAAVYFPNTILNTIVAEQIDELASELEKGGGDFNATLAGALQKRIKEHKKVIFNGNGYSEEWHKEAAKRGLPNLKTTIESLHAMPKPEYKALFAKYKVLNHKEYEAREEILWERYVKVVNIEALAVADIARNQIFPVAMKYQAELASTIKSSEGLSGVAQTAGKKALDAVIGNINELDASVEKLVKSHAAAEAQAGLPKKAEHYKDHVLPGMLEVRAVVDALETLVSDELWPLPKYREMLFQY
ncbi:MAG TPA: glutamine synthetase III [bacterium]|jgi:glutamine synthetase|nr:glutamine synthetase III [bacterium]